MLKSDTLVAVKLSARELKATPGYNQNEITAQLITQYILRYCTKLLDAAHVSQEQDNVNAKCVST